MSISFFINFNLSYCIFLLVGRYVHFLQMVLVMTTADRQAIVRIAKVVIQTTAITSSIRNL